MLVPKVTTAESIKRKASMMRDKDNPYKTPYDILAEGGKWLGALRVRIQSMCRNGDTVTWSSDDVLVPHLTVAQVERLAATAVYADRKEV